MIDLLMPTIAQGLLWAIMALGVYITYRVLDIADLTVEGSSFFTRWRILSVAGFWCGDAGWYAGWRCDRTFTY